MRSPMNGRASFDPEAIRELARILTETGLTEIEISDKDRRLRVVRAYPPAAATYAVAPAPAIPAAAPVAAAVTTEAAPDDPVSDPGVVPSPMVGIAFLSPEPGAAPYVQIGQAVQAGQTVMLIEAMKTFNQIKAPRAGTVTRLLVASGEPVEYGQPLLVIG